MRLPTVAIVGRPNVGKSSLFNRILRKQLAVVDEQAGVTRDRNYAAADWAGRSFYLVDTGGMVPETDDMMEQAIFDQAEFAINEADLVLLLVDAHTGLVDVDQRIARRLHKSKVKTLLVVNKVDNDIQENEIFPFLKLGLGDPSPASATTGRGMGDFLDNLVAGLPELGDVEQGDDKAIRVAAVGRPNVGKSSLINRLVGEDRLIVTPLAGTTRDAVDTLITVDNQDYILVDTAGLRRKYKVTENVEFYTNLRADRAIAGCDVAVVMVDAERGLAVQDQRILDRVFSNRRPAVLAVNKWDLVEKDTRTVDEYSRAIEELLARYGHLPVIYISALSGQRAFKVLSLVQQVHGENHKRIPTSQLNEWLAKTIGRKHPPAKQGRHIKINYVTQSEIAPPTFIFFANHPKLIEKSYISYLTNQIRKEFGFSGVPFRVKFRKK